MQNAGQTCISTERVYVEEPIYDEFVSKVVDKVRDAAHGRVRAGAATAEVGAIIHPPQSDIIEAHVKDAVDKGARVLVGGKRHDEHGHFFEPTVLVDVDHSMDCMREETFGPTLPIMKVARRRGGAAAGQRHAATGCRRRSTPRTWPRASGSPARSRPAP